MQSRKSSSATRSSAWHCCCACRCGRDSSLAGSVIGRAGAAMGPVALASSPGHHRQLQVGRFAFRNSASHSRPPTGRASLHCVCCREVHFARHDNPGLPIQSRAVPVGFFNSPQGVFHGRTRSHPSGHPSPTSRPTCTTTTTTTRTSRLGFGIQPRPQTLIGRH